MQSYIYLAGYAVVSINGREINLHVDGLTSGTPRHLAERLVREAVVRYCKSAAKKALEDLAFYGAVIAECSTFGSETVKS